MPEVPPRSRAQWVVFASALFAVELLIATVGRHLPVVRADLGDYLVVILIYAAAKSVRPGLRALPLACACFALGVAVEIAQALSLADRLGLARGSAASIALGNTFGFSDLAMYAAGCLTAWLLDAPGRAALTSSLRTSRRHSR
jgi:hypothetical protein